MDTKHFRRADYETIEEFCDAMSRFFEDCPNSTVIIDDMTEELVAEMEAFGFAGEPPTEAEIDEFLVENGF